MGRWHTRHALTCLLLFLVAYAAEPAEVTQNSGPAGALVGLSARTPAGVADGAARALLVASDGAGGARLPPLFHIYSSSNTPTGPLLTLRRWTRRRRRR